MSKKTAAQSQFHRSQIGRAQRYLRLHLAEHLTLASIAREAGSSCYHFARLFLAYTGETPFTFLRRIRLATALRMLQEDPDSQVTEIALSVGYETPSAFNKVFKKTLNLTPNKFRNLGKEIQSDVIYDLCQPPVQKEIKVNLTSSFEIITRPSIHFFYLENSGPFAESASKLWDDLCPIIARRLPQDKEVEFLGLSTIDKTKTGEESMIYQAGVAVADKPDTPIKGLQYKQVKSGKYARFVLTGSYSQIPAAFSQVFRILCDNNVTLRQEFCIENYIDDPQTTPENELRTELMVPVAD